MKSGKLRAIQLPSPGSPKRIWLIIANGREDIASVMTVTD